jgi:hypothetical protein
MELFYSVPYLPIEYRADQTHDLKANRLTEAILIPAAILALFVGLSTMAWAANSVEVARGLSHSAQSSCFGGSR